MKPEYARIDDLLVRLGLCDRNQAQSWIDAGRIGIIDTIVRSAAARTRAIDLRIDGKPLDHPRGILILFHKPVGYVCSYATGEGQRIYDLLPPAWLRRYPRPASIGRLDKDTSGLLLITDDTVYCHSLTEPKHRIEKVYLVTLNKPLEPWVAQRFASGSLVMKGDSRPCLPARLHQISETGCEVTLTEGRNRQIRRMFVECGYEVVSLHRTRFGDFELGDLPVGVWREVDPDPRAVPNPT